ncbi:MAG: adenylosuccinate lyase [Planctomycetes bacterium]|nr:adenylosuccinate lyase [Planctomycetota bacterium]
MGNQPQPPSPGGAPDAWSRFVSPLAGRYSSDAMQALWSPRQRFESWRRLWVALAQAQHELGLNVSREQVEALRGAVAMTDDDFRRAEEHEARLRHDVMAHVHAFGDRVPAARGVIHLGMTSQDINCNAETPIIGAALDLVAAKLARVIADLGRFAGRFADLPTLGFTHYQPAQPTTVGKRAAMWGHDLALCLERVEFTRASLRLRGLKGATGTQASFLALFNGDESKVDELERRFVAALGWPEGRVHAFTGQTYPRVTDAHVLSELASVAAAVHKVCNDLRLLCSRREVDEPFETHQIGSSAMPYKRNPMRCERTTGLCRVVMSLAASGTDTAATQWLERTLDDSSARRVALPEAFLALDGALDTLHNVCAGLVVHEASVKRNLAEELPFMATEVILMEAARLGRDRQDAHEAIRRHAQEAGLHVKQQGGSNDLIERLRAEPMLKGVDLDAALDPARHIGRAPSQARAFAEVAAGIASRYREKIAGLGEVSLKV